jgi:Trk K+ transport system NAD-binding subunit
VGTLSISDVVRAYRQELAASAERASELGAETGASRVTVEADSSINGKILRSAGLPKGLLITSITRGDQVFVPDGDTVFRAGDRLIALGRPSDLETLGAVDPRPVPTS